MNNQSIKSVNNQPQFTKIEDVLINGNLNELSDFERVNYYKNVCESLGLNPLTKPFAYIKLNGKEVLYAQKDCTDQLRKIHNVSIRITDRQVIEGVSVVTAQASLPSARCDESTGAVNIAGIKGESLANAMMKAETKAKRRATLSICGLGMLDENEVADIPNKDKGHDWMGRDEVTGNGVTEDPNTPLVKIGSQVGRAYFKADAQKLWEDFKYFEKKYENNPEKTPERTKEFFKLAEPYVEHLREKELEETFDAINQGSEETWDK